MLADLFDTRELLGDAADTDRSHWREWSMCEDGSGDGRGAESVAGGGGVDGGLMPQLQCSPVPVLLVLASLYLSLMLLSINLPIPNGCFMPIFARCPYATQAVVSTCT